MNQNMNWKKNYFTIIAGQTVSLIGSSATQFTLIWWLASETASPMMLSAASLFAFLPQLFIGPFAGVWVDRMKRKHVMIGADLFIGFVALVLSIYFFIGIVPYWTIFLALGLRAMGNVFHTPAAQAAVPMLVPTEELVKANGWSQFLQSGAFMLGPVFGAAMYAAFPLWVILLADLLGAIIASITVAIVPIPDPPARTDNTKPHFFQEMKTGAKVFLSDRNLFIITLTCMIIMIFYSPVASLYPLMTSDYFKLSEWHASAVQITYAGGMMLCSFFLGKYGTVKNKFAVIYGALFSLGLCILLCGLLPSSNILYFWVFALLCGLLSISSTLYNVPFVAYMQEAIPPEMLGRAFSVMGSMMSAALPLGLLIAGPTAEKYGVVRWFSLSGIAICVITGVSALVFLNRHKKRSR